MNFIALILIVVASWLIIRSNKVCNFRISLALLHLSDTQIWKLHNKYTYNQMLFSLKPLKLEAWFTEEELKEDNND